MKREKKSLGKIPDGTGDWHDVFRSLCNFAKQRLRNDAKLGSSERCRNRFVKGGGKVCEIERVSDEKIGSVECSPGLGAFIPRR